MVTHLVRHGDGYALVIDEPTLRALRIGPDTPLEVSTSGRTILVAPASEEQRGQRISAALEAINRDHAEDLRRLAE